MFDKLETLKVLMKGVSNADEQALKEKIEEVYKEGRVLNIKFGMDPSAPDIHLGHAVALRKIRQLQNLGHKLSIIIGDFTGMIGDPSGKSKTRNQLSKEQVKENAKTYVEQIFKIIDRNKTTVLFNSDWYASMTFPEIISLCSKATVARILERDDFANRYKNQTPIALHEFFYPLMQAYDSVVCKADIEMGGTDQTFNIMLGRNIQKDYGVSQQVPLFVPLLEGIDGIEKMSKSLGNYIGIDEEPKVIFEKAMKVPDELIIRYYELTTDVSPDNIEVIKTDLKNGKNPRDVKMDLASELVKLYHGEGAVESAKNYFVSTYQKNVVSEQTPILKCGKEFINEEGTINIIDLIFSSNKYKSKGEIRRLIQSCAVKVNGEKINDFTYPIVEEMVIQIGKGTMFKIEFDV